jgi:hypothetical protein
VDAAGWHHERIPYVRLGDAEKGGAALLTKRDEGGLVAFDDLATGLESGAISRGNAIKLAGAALAASALGLFASRGADAQEVDLAIRRKKCLRKGGDYCARNGNSVCCGAGGRHRKACCGPNGAACCSKNERCDAGKCKKH